MSVAKISRRLKGRAYELALRCGLASYRRPFQHCDDTTWDQGYSTSEHDHYEGVAERPRYGAVASYLGLNDGPLDILDIGCGTGILRERIPDEKVRSFVGIDTSAAGIIRANARELARTEFKVSAIPDEGEYDAVITNEMLYFVPDVEPLLDKAKGLLRPGGLFVTSNTKFAGDFWLRDRIAERFTLLDESIVVTVANQLKWRVGCYHA